MSFPILRLLLTKLKHAMKKLFFSFLAILFVSATLISCKSKSDPKSVASNFLNALTKMDYETAKKYGTPETGKMLDMLSSFAGMMPDSVKAKAKETKVEIKNVKENGNDCVVTYANSDKPNDDQTLNLIKKDGKWLVNMSKDESMGEPASNEPDTSAYSEPPVDETVPTDSVNVNNQ